MLGLHSCTGGTVDGKGMIGFALRRVTARGAVASGVRNDQKWSKVSQKFTN